MDWLSQRDSTVLEKEVHRRKKHEHKQTVASTDHDAAPEPQQGQGGENPRWKGIGRKKERK